MDETFWKKLKAVYLKEDAEEKPFEQEREILEHVFKKLDEEISDIYDFMEPLGRGGAGIVIKLKDKRLNINRALKIPRPIKIDLIESVTNEIKYLREIRHDNVISIYTLGELEIAEYEHPYPYFVMDYIKDAQDLKKKNCGIVGAM